MSIELYNLISYTFSSPISEQLECQYTQNDYANLKQIQEIISEYNAMNVLLHNSNITLNEKFSFHTQNERKIPLNNS